MGVSRLRGCEMWGKNKENCQSKNNLPGFKLDKATKIADMHYKKDTSYNKKA